MIPYLVLTMVLFLMLSKSKTRLSAMHKNNLLLFKNLSEAMGIGSWYNYHLNII